MTLLSFLLAGEVQTQGGTLIPVWPIVCWNGKMNPLSVQNEECYVSLQVHTCKLT